MRYVVKRLSLLMSLVVMVSSFSVNAFACPAPITWDDIPNIVWTDEAEDPASTNGGFTTSTQLADLDSDSEEVEPEVAYSEEPALLRASATLAGTSDQMVTKNYAQPAFPVKEGYDAISVFITDDGSNTSYNGKVYFVISGNQWCLYNYKQETADKFFTEVEDFNGMKIPTKKSDTRADNQATVSVDESKIPLITRTAFNAMYCNWRSFEDIPFTKDEAGKLIYATYQVKSSGETPEDKKDDPNPPKSDDKSQSNNQPGTPSANSSTSSKYYRYTVSLNNGNTYRIFVTKSVSYDGKKHVLTTAKSGKKKTNDIEVYVYLNGQLVEPKLYKVQFKNNKNCNGYGNNQKVIPYFRLKFKFKNKSLKGDIKAMRRKAFGFNINPLDISKGTVSYKTVKNGQLKKATISISGNTMKLEPPKGSKGDYTLTNENGKTVLVGKNNFINKLVLDSAPVNNNNNGGGQIY